MRKSEIFAIILATVAAETEIDESVILSACKVSEVVDARYMLIYFLHDFGFSAAEIARLTRLARQTVNYMLSNLDIRRQQGGRIFDFTFRRIDKILAEY